ncbi:MAG: hypothetical protein U9N36_08645 [Euryarchaeota archaeon]|nr:hypothetical protein [Euryarchaeota archaeon]
MCRHCVLRVLCGNGSAVDACVKVCNYSGMLIGLPIAILYFLARKITAEGAEER